MTQRSSQLGQQLETEQGGQSIFLETQQTVIDTKQDWIMLQSRTTASPISA